jgi:uncharacterized protein YbaP (TraB family)
MLWRVESDSTVVYIMGSVHALPKSYYPLDTILDRSLDSSDILVLEVDLDEGAAMQLAQRVMTGAVLDEGQTLSSVLSKKTYAMTKARLKKSGIDIAMFERLEPWAVGLMLMGLELRTTGFSGDLGVDAHFSDRARSESKEVIGLETVEDQLGVFESMAPPTQEEFLRQMLTDGDATSSTLKGLAAAWRRGDLKSTEKSLAQMRRDTSFYQAMLVNRNRAWLPKIEAFLNDSSRRYLVVVGAAHLVGRDGVIEMLKAKGFTPVQM